MALPPPTPVILLSPGSLLTAAASLPWQGWVNSWVPAYLSIPPGTGLALQGAARLIPVLLSQGTNKLLHSLAPLLASSICCSRLWWGIRCLDGF